MDFIKKITTFEQQFDKKGTNRLVIDVHPVKPLIYEVYCKDAIEISKEWSDELMVGTFKLKLIEPEPVKRVLKHIRVNESTKTCTITLTSTKYVNIYWGDGSVDYDISGDSVKITHNYDVNGDYFPVVTGCIDEISSFETNAIIVWGANIIITQPNGNRVPMQNRRTATGITSAKQNWGLNAEDTVDITIESPFPQTYNIGDKITVFGRDYKLNRLPSVKKTGMHQFQYTLQFEGVQYDLFRITYDLTIDTTTNELQDVQGDTLTGNLHRFMTVLIANANRVFPGKWKLGACPDTIGDKTLTFGESDNCLSVLQNLCGQSNFNVEFEIVQSNGVYTVNLYERVGQTLPFTFEYGKGRGLYDLHRENVSSSNIVTRLKVYGSTENITSKYRADRLCLPGKTKGQSYIEKPEMIAKYGIFEGRKNFDDVKPTFTGSVESVVDTFSFIDKKFPFDLNATNASGETLYLINGVSAKIHFNTGNLAGYDFEVKSYDHATHKFTLLKTTDDRGDVFPIRNINGIPIRVGNEYKILDVAYPSDIEAEAEAKLAEVGNKYYDQKLPTQSSIWVERYQGFLGKSWLEQMIR